MKFTNEIRGLACGISLSIVPVLGGCGDNIIAWKEDVKLLDGRVISVVQKRRIEQGKMPREAWLTFKLPEFSNQEIEWHENLETQVLNVYRGKLYVVGVPATEDSFRQYGKPYPEYVPFRYEAGKWLRIGFGEVPEEIYDANMFCENMTLYRLDHVSLAHKDNMLKDDRYVPGLKRMTPTFKTPH